MISSNLERYVIIRLQRERRALTTWALQTQNEDLVSRLQIYAQSLLDKEKHPENTTVSNTEGVRESNESARASQQWEIVEDGTEEEAVKSNPRSRTMSMRSAMSISTFKSIGSAKDFGMGSLSSKSMCCAYLPSSLLTSSFR